MDQPDNFVAVTDSFTTTQERNRAKHREWCELEAALQSIRSYWKASIIVAISERPRTLKDLGHRLDPANPRVLLRALRELQKDELLVRRTDEAVTYVLTDAGKRLASILSQLTEWQRARR